MSSDYAFLDDAPEENRCAMCSQKRLVVSVTINRQVYGFCPRHQHRGTLLQRGQANNWPALRIEGITGTYALDSDVEAYFLTAIWGTDERVVELLDVFDEYEAAHREEKAS